MELLPANVPTPLPTSLPTPPSEPLPESLTEPITESITESITPLQGTPSQGTPPQGLLLALQSTLRLHPAVRGKLAEVESKRFAGESARAQRYPSLSTQWALQNEGQPGSVRARQPIWAFGRIDSTIAYADVDAQAEVADLLRVQRQLLDQAAVAYVRAHGARLRAQVGEDNQTQLQRLYERIKRRELGQLASPADVRLAQARLTQARAQRDRLESEWQLAQTELDALTQIPVDSRVAVPAEIRALGAAPTLDALLAAAQAQHADLRLKDQHTQLTEADITKEKLAAMPGVFIQADHSFNSAAGQGSNSSIGFVFEAGLDNLGFATRGRVRGAEARRDAARADRDSTLSEVQRLIKSLHLQRQTQHQMIASQQQSVDELLSLLASYQRQYEAGYKSWLEVLNMQRELTEQRLLYVQAETDWLTHALRLAALLGSLDSLSGLSLPTPATQDPLSQWLR